jgi:outer membrane protein assembly factor BamB
MRHTATTTRLNPALLAFTHGLMLNGFKLITAQGFKPQFLKKIATTWLRVRYVGLSRLLPFLAVGLAACTSNKTPPTPLLDFQPSLRLVSKWMVSVDAVNAAPTLLRNADGQQLLLAQGTAVSLHQADTGATNWRSPIGLVQAALGVSSDQQTALALVQGEEAVALDVKSGQVRWRSALPAEMRTQPVAVGEVFVVLTADGRIVGLDQNTGRRRWALARALPALSLRGSGAVAGVGRHLAVIGLPGGKAIGVNVLSGQVVWETALATPKGVNEVERIADVLPQWVTVSGLGVCATSYKQRAVCVDDQGQITHAQDMLATSGLVVSGLQWFALQDDASVKAWTLKQQVPNAGQAPLQWTFEGLKGRIGNGYQTIATVGSAVMVHDSTGVLHALSSSDGKTIARSNTGIATDAYVLPGQEASHTTFWIAGDKSLQAWQIAQ